MVLPETKIPPVCDMHHQKHLTFGFTSLTGDFYSLFVTYQPIAVKVMVA